MRIGTNASEVTVDGSIDSGALSIEANAVAFRVLSDTLYQDKIGSIVREIACNGLDAHNMVNAQDKPIEIHVPSTLEPEFRVRDFGPGLSNDQIRTVFTVIFASTKRGSDTDVGGFGLGAKTPLSYTTQFTVSSFQNGTVNVYVIYIGDDGLPRYSRMYEGETTEPDGLEVNVPVEAEHFNLFRDAIAQQLRFFPVPPTLTNAGGLAITARHHRPPILETDSMAIFDSSGYGGRIIAVHGPVGYQVDISLLRPFVTPRAFQMLQRLESVNAQLYFNIGELKVTASREGLEYLPQTVNGIVSIIDRLDKELTSTLVEKINAAASDMERLKVIYDNIGEIKTYYTIFRELPKSIIFDSPVIKLMYVDLTLRHNITPTESAFARYGVSPAIYRVPEAATIPALRPDSSNNYTRITFGKDDYTEVSKHTVVVIRDSESTPIATVRNWLNAMDVKDRPSQIIMFTEPADADKGWVSKFEADTLNLFKVYRISDMPVVKRASGTKSVRTSLYYTQHATIGNSCADWQRMTTPISKLTMDDFDDGDVIAYVVRDRTNIPSRANQDEAIKTFNTLRGSPLISNIVVLAVMESEVSKITASIGARPLNEFMDEVVAQIKADPKYSRNATRRAMLQSVSSSMIVQDFTQGFQRIVETMEKNGGSGRVGKLYRLGNAATVKLRQYPHMHSGEFEIAKPVTKPSNLPTVLKDQMEAVRAKYPMIGKMLRVSRYCFYEQEAIDAAIDYMNLIDQRENA